MNRIEPISFYAVMQNLSVIKCHTLEDCISQEDFIYAIVETKSGGHNSVTIFNKVPFYNPDLEIKLIGKDKASFEIIENNWKVININIGFPKKGWGYARTLPAMDIADPLGNVVNMSADIEYYEGIIQLHKLLRYISKSPNWDIANEHKNRMDLKKIFIRLKNGHPIHRSLYINPDEDHSIELSFKNGFFILNSCIVEGNPYDGGSYRNEEQYESTDFYHFIDTVKEKFPAIDLKNLP